MADANLSIGIHTSQAKRDAKEIIDVLEDVQDAADKLSDGADFHIDTSGLDADAKKVTDTLKDIENEASKISETPIDIKVDTKAIEDFSKTVKETLNEIVDRGKKTTVPINFDAGGVPDIASELVDKLKNEIDKNLERGIDVETSLKIVTDAAEAEIDKLLREVESDPIEIPVSLTSVEGGETVVDKLERDLESEGVKIPVSVELADTGGVDALKADVESEGVSISVSADTNEAAEEIEKLQRDAKGRFLPKGSQPVITPVVDPNEAKEGLDKLQRDSKGRFLPRGSQPVITPEVDTSGVDSSLAALLKKIQEAMERASKSADGLASSLKSLAMSDELLEVLGEAILIVATSMVTAITEFENYQDAVEAATGSSESAALAMEMLEEFALNTSASIDDVVEAFTELRTNGLEASRSSLEAYGNVAAGLNLTMTEMAEAVGDAAARNFSKLNETQLKAKESGDKVIFTYHGVKTEVDNTSKAIAEFIKNLGNTEFAGKMADQADGVTGAFEEMQEAWRELSRDIGEGGLNEGLIKFQKSMSESSREADGLGRMFGGWLGGHLETFGNLVEFTVRVVNLLVEGFKDLRDAIMSLPVIGTVLSGVSDMRAAIFSKINSLVPEVEEGAPSVTANPPSDVAERAFGTDTETERTRRPAAKTEAQRQQESFEKQFAGNERMIRTLGMMNDAYDEGRIVVSSVRHEIEKTADKTSLLSQVGEKNVDAILDQKAAMKGLKEAFAYKGEVLDQQEAIMQTVQLTEAYKNGSGAVKDAKASAEGYNKAVELGVIGSADLVAELTELARAAIQANDNLKFEESMTGFDRQIESAAKMATAFREGGPAIREAALEQAVYAQAVADGVEEDEGQVQIIREKMLALRDLQDVQKSDERAMNTGLDIEQMQRELGLHRLMGEARFMEAARIDALMTKKRELKDVTAELTAEELKQADALGRMQYQAANAGNSLLELAERYGDVNKQMQNVALGGALALEDSLVDIVTGAKTAREAFADFARTVAEQMMRAAIQMAIIRPLLMGLGGMFAGGGVMTSSGPASLPMYAKGGVMSPLGDIPLKTYSTGGIANSPQMAIFGEGKMPEAYVPLPDGRRIPVKMEGGGGGGGNALAITNNINVNMPQNATREQGEQFGDAIARQVEDAMNANLMKQQRPGGLLDPYGYGAA